MAFPVPAFLLSPLARIAAGVLVGALVSGGVYLKGRWDGSAACQARWEQKAADEAQRQSEVNRQALDRAYRAVEALAADRDRLADIIRENEDEARQDPLGDHCGVSADGVRRLNRVR